MWLANLVLQSEIQQTLDSTNAELAKLQAVQLQQPTSVHEGASQDQVEKLRQDLAQAHQDAESLRASASVNASLNNMSTEDGEKPISEQLTERVGEIRKELESRHKERVAQLEETYTTRTNGMKAQLQNKLTEGKEKYRQAIAAEHEQAIQKLKSDQEDEMESLRIRHRDEVDELKRHEESRFSQFKDDWVSDHPRTHDGASDVKAEVQAPKPITEVSDAEAQELVKHNNYVRGVLRQNVTKQVNAEREKIIGQLKEAHEKELAVKLAEVQNKATTAKEQAVSMENKRNHLKVTMADNKAKIALAKIEVVQTAAKDTPSKPVAEVWEVAKDVKAPAAPAQSQSAKDGPAPQPKAPSNIFGQSTSFGQPSVVPQGTRPPGQTPALASGFGKPSGFGEPSFPAPAKTNPFGQPSTFAQSSQDQGQNGAPPSPFVQPAQTQNGEAQPESARQSVLQGSVSQQTGSLPTQPNQPRSRDNSPNASSLKNPQKAANGPQQSQSKANNPFSQGTGPAAARSLQQSGLPVARGGANRGGGNQRGRGQSRGGPQSLSTSQVPIQPQGRGSPKGRNSPVSAGLTAAAKQFVPGNKRPREDGQEGSQAEGGHGNGKRIRGGSSGS